MEYSDFFAAVKKFLPNASIYIGHGRYDASLDPNEIVIYTGMKCDNPNDIKQVVDIEVFKDL